MIATDDRRAARAGVPNGVELNNRIDLECARRIGGNVRRRQDGVDPVARPQQQSADLAHGVGSGQRHYLFDQPA